MGLSNSRKIPEETYSINEYKQLIINELNICYPNVLSELIMEYTCIFNQIEPYTMVLRYEPWCIIDDKTIRYYCNDTPANKNGKPYNYNNYKIDGLHSTERIIGIATEDTWSRIMIVTS